MQPVEQTGREGVTRADRVHEVDRNGVPSHLQAGGDGKDAGAAAGDDDEGRSRCEPVSRDILVRPVGVEPAQVLIADLDDIGEGDETLDIGSRIAPRHRAARAARWDRKKWSHDPVHVLAPRDR